MDIDHPAGWQTGGCAGQFLGKPDYHAGAPEVSLSGQHVGCGVCGTKELTMDLEVAGKLLSRSPSRVDVLLGFGSLAQPSRQRHTTQVQRTHGEGLFSTGQ